MPTVLMSLPIKDPVLIFALVMLILLVAPLLCMRLRIPGLIGLILAGAVVGPQGVGLLARDDTMQLLGQVGLLFIVFIAGLEIDLNQFIRHRHRSIVFGLISFWIPQTIGAAIALRFLGFEWNAAVLLASMFGSHTLLTYPIASRLGIAKNPAVVTTVGGTIITDTIALLILAIIASAAQGVALDAQYWLTFGGSMAIFLGLIGWGLPALGRWFFRNIIAEGPAQFTFIVAAVFSFAYLAQAAGMQAIIGAFLAGLALNRLVPPHSTLMSRIEFVGHALFIPFFLVSVGMLVDVRVFAAGYESWLIAGFMVTTVITTKWLAAMATRLIFRFSMDQGWVIFGMSINQAAATLAAVFIGVKIDLFGPEVLNGTILMILVTCILGAWATEKYGRRLAMKEEEAPRAGGDLPERILVPLANPSNAPMLMDLAMMVRTRDSHEPIYPLTVARDGEDVRIEVASSEKLLASAVVHGAAANVPVTPVTRVDAHVANGIIRATKEIRASNMIVGWDGRPTSRWHVHGRVLDEVIKNTPQMIMVSRCPAPLNITSRVQVLVPPFANREPGFHDAVQAIKNLASQLGAPIQLISPDDIIKQTEKAFKAIRPDVPLQTYPINSWGTLPGAIPHEADATDMLILLGAREGRIAWSPSLDYLPRVIARTWPKLNFIVVYPTEVVAEVSSNAGLPQIPVHPMTVLQAHNISMDLGDIPYEEALRIMLRSSLEGSPQSYNNVFHAVNTCATNYSVEVTPGVVLLHAHSDDLNQTILQVGISQQGITFPHVRNPVHAIFILLSPTSNSAEQHLLMLAGIARMVRQPQIVTQLRQAESAQQVRTLLAISHAIDPDAPNPT